MNVSGAEMSSGWVILNPKDDHKAQLENQKLVLDILDQGLTVYWFVSSSPSIRGVHTGDYVIPRQKNENYAIALF